MEHGILKPRPRQASVRYQTRRAVIACGQGVDRSRSLAHQLLGSAAVPILPRAKAAKPPPDRNLNGAFVCDFAAKRRFNAPFTATVRVMLWAAHHPSSSRPRALGNPTLRAKLILELHNV